MKERETLEMHVHLLYTCLTHSPARGTIKCLMFSWERKWMALLLYTLLMCNYNSDEKRAIIIVLMRHSSFSLTHYWKALITMFSVTVTAWASVVNAQRCLGTFVQLENSHNCLALLSLSNGITVFYWWSNDETDLFFDWLSWTVSEGVNEITITWEKSQRMFNWIFTLFSVQCGFSIPIFSVSVSALPSQE